MGESGGTWSASCLGQFLPKNDFPLPVNHSGCSGKDKTKMPLLGLEFPNSSDPYSNNFTNF